MSYNSDRLVVTATVAGIIMTFIIGDIFGTMFAFGFFSIVIVVALVFIVDERNTTPVDSSGRLIHTSAPDYGTLRSQLYDAPPPYSTIIKVPVPADVFYPAQSYGNHQQGNPHVPLHEEQQNRVTNSMLNVDEVPPPTYEDIMAASDTEAQSDTNRPQE